jgi:hypothetical protein
MGNHEALPVNEFDFTGNYSDWWYTMIAPLFRGDLDDEAYNELSTNLYFSQLIKEKNLRVISLNANADNNDDWLLM